MIFVRNVLHTIHSSDSTSFACFVLETGFNLKKAPHAYSAPGEARYFQIVNVGNDNAVLSQLLARVPGLFRAGFGRAIGLRDMYSEAYRKVVSGRRIDQEAIGRFRRAAEGEIAKRGFQKGVVDIRFAVMEIKAWLLAMPGVLEKMNGGLTPAALSSHLGIQFPAITPEADDAFYHPAAVLGRVYQMVGESYQKRRGQIESLTSHIDEADLLDLYESGRCPSFNAFFDCIA